LVGVGGAGFVVAAGVDPGLEVAGREVAGREVARLEVAGLEVARSDCYVLSLSTAAAGGGSQCSCEQIVEPSRRPEGGSPVAGGRASTRWTRWWSTGS